MCPAGTQAEPMLAVPKSEVTAVTNQPSILLKTAMAHVALFHNFPLSQD